MPNLKSDLLLALDKRFQIYLVLYNYYQGKLWEPAQWSNALDRLNDYSSYSNHLYFEKGLKMLANASVAEVNVAVYDYNRLFVGPGKLLAPPYESTYLNPAGLIMQQETLDVRKFYEKVGLQVLNKGFEPDDHLLLQLELICYLLSRCAKSLIQDGEVSYESYHQLMGEFFEKHLQKWIFKHCDDIFENSNSNVCYGMSLILQGFMELEQNILLS